MMMFIKRVLVSMWMVLPCAQLCVKYRKTGCAGRERDKR